MKQKLWITLPKNQNEFDEWARWVEKGLLKVKLTGKFSGSVPAMLFKRCLVNDGKVVVID